MGSHQRGRFRINKAEGKVLGVCAGIADHFAIDVTLVRIGMALAILTTFPLVLIAYVILAMVADSGGRRERPRRRLERRTLPGGDRSAEAARQRMRDMDARLQAMESYVTSSSNSQLAREIDALR